MKLFPKTIPAPFPQRLVSSYQWGVGERKVPEITFVSIGMMLRRRKSSMRSSWWAFSIFSDEKFFLRLPNDFLYFLRKINGKGKRRRKNQSTVTFTCQRPHDTKIDSESSRSWVGESYSILGRVCDGFVFV